MTEEELDKKVLAAADSFDLPEDASLSPEGQAALLYFIIRRHPTVHASWIALADSTMLENAKKKCPSFEEDLQEAWRTKKFSSIRKAVMFSEPVDQPAAQGEMREEVENLEATRKTSNRSPKIAADQTVKPPPAVQAAWVAPYQKYHHRLLYNSLRNMKYDDKHLDYANTVSILQSSGTGKSRMIDETASLLFTFPFNLRDSKESKYLAYPPPDDSVREYLGAQSANKSELIVRMRYHCFFAHLFDVANAHVRSTRSDLQCSHKELASEWRNYLKTKTNRVDFYAKVLERTETSLKMTTAKAEQSGQSEKEMMEIMITQAREKFADLQATIHACTSDTDKALVVLIYFDESHMLSQLTAQNKTANHSRIDSPYPLYFILLSVFNSYEALPLFGVFLSTVSQVGNFAPPPEYFMSARAIASTFHRAPITETPFDCAPDLDIELNSLTKEEVASGFFMAKFGRPMFWTMLQTASSEFERQSLLRSLLRTVRSKLLGTQRDLDSDAMSSHSKEANLAVVDVRLCLEYGPNMQANRMQEKLIASHMRVVYSVPQHRHYFRSGYSSEPIIAEAAAQQLNLWRNSSRTALIEPLSTHMKSGLLDRGERGEAIARALLTEAYDQAVIESWKTKPPGDKNFFSEGCSAIHFFEALFPPDTAAVVLDSTPENVDGRSLRCVIGKAWIRFTHFVKAIDDHAVNTVAMAAAFIRGMAFICHAGQRQVDLLIPMLLSGDEKIGESVMSGILVQVKLRSSSGAYSIDAEELRFFDTVDTEPRPYVALFMDLGRRKNPPKPRVLNVIEQHRQNQADSSSSITPAEKVSPKRPKNTDHIVVTKNRRRRTTVKLHPRYRINVLGCSDTVYGVIDKNDKWEWKKLLSFDDLLHDHPRPEMQPYVMELRPNWSIDSYGWLGHPFNEKDSNRTDSNDGRETSGIFIPDESSDEEYQDSEYSVEQGS